MTDNMTHEKDEPYYDPLQAKYALSLLQRKQGPSHLDPVEPDDTFQLHQRCDVVLGSAHKLEEE